MRRAVAPRRNPGQERSRITVRAIIEAAARVFSARGFTGASTNRIADAAGVSVGSLYQYFPDKAALLVAVESGAHERLMARLHAACAAPSGNLAGAIEAIVTAAADQHHRDARLRRVFARHLPASAARPPGRTHFHAGLRQLLERHQDELSVDPETALFLLRNFARTILSAAVEHRADELESGAMARTLTRAAMSLITATPSTRSSVRR
jgi:AcrR family transcriptional regulator